MSHAADRWLALPRHARPYGDGQQGGVPHLCVKHVACSYCGSKPGQLCRGHAGPTLRHHVPRGVAFLGFKRAHPGLVPPYPNRIQQLEQRLARVERRLDGLP